MQLRARIGRVVAFTALIGTLGACKSTDPAFLDSEGKPLEETLPVLYTVALAPVNLGGQPLDGGVAADDPLRFQFDPEQLQRELVAELEHLHAASAVYAVGDDDLGDARAKRADLLVRPRLRAPASLQHIGVSQHGLLAGVLWLTTWAGSFWVEDSSYNATLALDFDIVNPYEGVKIDSVSASSDAVDLSFVDRDSLISWSGLESLVVPPFWTHDERQKTSAALSRIASARLGARLARYLKEDLATSERDFLGEVRLQAPKNGAQVGPVAALKGKVIAKEAITSLALYLNDSDVPVFEQTDASLPPVAEQRVGNVYQVFLEHELKLAPGKNLVAMEIGISGHLTSRTLVVYNGLGEAAR